MKVILQQDILHLGKRHDVKDVSSGYARNFLFARGLAIPATDAALKSAATERMRQEREQSAEYEKYKALAEKLSQTTLHFKIKIGEKDKKTGGLITESLLTETSGASAVRKRSPGFPEKGKRAFGSVTTLKIKEALIKQGIEVEMDWIQLENAIKTTGEEKVKIRIAPGVETEVSLIIEAEK